MESNKPPQPASPKQKPPQPKKKISLKDNSSRAKIVQIAFVAIILVIIITIISGLKLGSLLERMRDGGDFTMEEIYSNHMRQILILIINALIQVATIIFFLLWFGRAYANINRVAPKSTLHTNSFVIWSFFIPIISLYKPYQIAQEIVELTQKIVNKFGVGGSFRKAKFAIGIWWAMFIISNLAVHVPTFLRGRNPAIDDLISANMAATVANILRLLSAAAALYMVRQVALSEAALGEAVAAYNGAIEEEREGKEG